MNIPQILFALGFFALGAVFLYVGIRIIINKKTRKWFAHWWYLDSTEKGQKFLLFTIVPILFFMGVMIISMGLVVVGLFPTSIMNGLLWLLAR